MFNHKLPRLVAILVSMSTGVTGAAHADITNFSVSGQCHLHTSAHMAFEDGPKADEFFATEFGATSYVDDLLASSLIDGAIAEGHAHFECSSIATPTHLQISISQSAELTQTSDPPALAKGSLQMGPTQGAQFSLTTPGTFSLSGFIHADKSGPKLTTASINVRLSGGTPTQFYLDAVIDQPGAPEPPDATESVPFSVNGTLPAGQYRLTFYMNLNVSSDSGLGHQEAHSAAFGSATLMVTSECSAAQMDRGECAPVDTDEDGLLDDWELNGYPYLDASQQLQRYKFGDDDPAAAEKRRLHKDIYVEIDAMKQSGPKAIVVAGVPSHLATGTALDIVVRAFASAPAELVDNPDGLPGIDLHLIMDDALIDISSWTKDINTDAEPDFEWPSAFDAVKLAALSGTTQPGYFGTVSERNDVNGAAIRDAKAHIFHYCIFAVQLLPDIPTGIGERPGNDFSVTINIGGSSGTPEEQAGTFMHELGHNLGLSHGGDDHVVNKPNYYSVMNYMWQTPQPWMVLGSWPLDQNRPGYSDLRLDPLFESQLIDCQPLVGQQSPLAGVVFPHNSLNIPNPQVGPNVKQARMDLPVNWDITTGPACSAPLIAVDVNRLKKSEPSSLGDVLFGFEDWSHLRYDFRTSPSFAEGIHTSEDGVTLDELTAEDLIVMANLVPPFCPGDVNYDQKVDRSDLRIVLSLLNKHLPYGSLADIAPVGAPDGIVDLADLYTVLDNIGACP